MTQTSTDNALDDASHEPSDESPILVIHDIFDFKGGGERTALTLAYGLETDLFSGTLNRNSFDISLPGGCSFRTLDCRLPTSLFKTLMLILYFRYRTRFINTYQRIIFSGWVCLFAIHNHRNGPNIWYCYTPPRDFYDQYQQTYRNASWGKRILMHLVLPGLRKRFEQAVKQVDLIIAISETIQDRVKHSFEKPSVVVYPPCDVDLFHWIEQEEFYLSTARLVPLKRVDRIVQAFLGMPHKRLVVVSTGSEWDSLKQRAAGAANIQFTGSVSDETLRDLMGKCLASIYIPQNEDFGISPVESMAAGKPVIGVAEGGLRETVLDGETGILLPPDPSAEAIREAVIRMTPETALSMREACEKRAKRFSRERFITEMKAIVDKYR
ncbi:MAG: glycosyltransferase [Magnetococcales bacterium]|nr:glycosyltransferase [Magnetococcales bacterium]